MFDCACRYSVFNTTFEKGSAEKMEMGKGNMEEKIKENENGKWKVTVKA